MSETAEASRPAGKRRGIELPQSESARTPPRFLRDIIRENPKAFDFSDIESREEAERRNLLGEDNIEEPTINQMLGLHEMPIMRRGLNFYPFTLPLEDIEEISKVSDRFKAQQDEEKSPLDMFSAFAEFATFVLYVDIYEERVYKINKRRNTEISQLQAEEMEQFDAVNQKFDQQILHIKEARELRMQDDAGIEGILRKATIEEVKRHFRPSDIDFLIQMVRIHAGIRMEEDEADGKKN